MKNRSTQKKWNLKARMKRRDQQNRNQVGKLEAAPGFEPGMRVLQTRALPLGDAAPVNSLI